MKNQDKNRLKKHNRIVQRDKKRQFITDQKNVAMREDAERLYRESVMHVLGREHYAAAGQDMNSLAA